MMVQKQKAEYRQITLTTRLVGMMQDTKVSTDKMRLQQVLLSYQSNALKFTPQGGIINIIASIRTTPNGKKFLDIEVKDNGCGISEENQAKLFKLFGYLDETSELNTRGVGLGLYITKMIVTQFEGQVSVKSKIGEGSSFCLSFGIQS
jgi:signal transduction histidine kinase